MKKLALLLALTSLSTLANIPQTFAAIPDGTLIVTGEFYYTSHWEVTFKDGKVLSRSFDDVDVGDQPLTLIDNRYGGEYTLIQNIRGGDEITQCQLIFKYGQGSDVNGVEVIAAFDMIFSQPDHESSSVILARKVQVKFVPTK